MNRDQLNKANNIQDQIDNYKNRFTAFSLIKNGTATPRAMSIEIQAYDGKNYHNDSYSEDESTRLKPEIREVIREEILLAAERIARIFEKEIRKLEKEFESI